MGLTKGQCRCLPANNATIQSSQQNSTNNIWAALHTKTTNLDRKGACDTGIDTDEVAEDASGRQRVGPAVPVTWPPGSAWFYKSHTPQTKQNKTKKCTNQSKSHPKNKQ